MQDSDIIITLARVLCVAHVFGFLTLRLGRSPIVGYLLSRLAAGSYTTCFVAYRAVAY